MDTGDQVRRHADLLGRARTGGAQAAEVFGKTARGRRLVLEPGVLRDGRPRLTVATSLESGVALRILGRAGGWGMSWRSPFEAGSQAEIVREAFLAAALHRPGRHDGATGIPCAPPGGALPAAADLGLFDPGVLDRPARSLRQLLQEAAETAREACGPRAVIDAVTLSEAVLTIDLLNSEGFAGCYTRTLALLSVLIAPTAPGARAVMEERSASRLEDLDARACGLDAARRSLGARGTLPPASASPPVVLLPRAAAELLVRLVPSLLASGEEAPAGRRGGLGSAGERRSTAGGGVARTRGARIVDDGRLQGAFGSAPFDGVGRPTSTTVLLDDGRLVGRLSFEGGNVTRPSLREPPALGLSNLRLIRPGWTGAEISGRIEQAKGGRRTIFPAPGPLLDPGAAPCLLIEAARCLPGPSFGIEVLRGEWRARGAPAGAADGLIWEGHPATILRAVTGVGHDEAAFHPGLPVVVPSLRLEGLGAWRRKEEGPAAGVRRRRPIRPPGPPE